MGERAEVKKEEICPIPRASSAITQNSPRTALEHEGSGMLFPVHRLTEVCIQQQTNSTCVSKGLKTDSEDLIHLAAVALFHQQSVTKGQSQRKPPKKSPEIIQ